ncbi:MAG: hypothetical protein ACP5UN_03945, partial [Candidatus Micrarchaeia archaeon]
MDIDLPEEENMNKNIFAVIMIIFIISLLIIPQGNSLSNSFSNSLSNSHQEKFNINMQIYAFNLTLPTVWGVYGNFIFSYSGIEKFIPITNITNYYINNINISFTVNNSINTTLKYNLSLFLYNIQNYKPLTTSIFNNGSLSINSTLQYYNISLNSSYISFVNENN